MFQYQDALALLAQCTDLSVKGKSFDTIEAYASTLDRVRQHRTKTQILENNAIIMMRTQGEIWDAAQEALDSVSMPNHERHILEGRALRAKRDYTQACKWVHMYSRVSQVLWWCECLLTNFQTDETSPRVTARGESGKANPND